MKQTHKKSWTILGEVTRHDLETLHRAKVNVTIVTDDYPVDTTLFHTQAFLSAKQEVQIITDTDEQEAWLKLCFGDRLHHFSTIYDIE